MEDAGSATVDRKPVPLSDGFESASDDAWRELVARGLKGAEFSSLVSHTPDGIKIQPLYEATSNGVVSGSAAADGWQITTLADHTDPDQANKQILRDLQAGATALSIAFEHAPAAGGFGLPASENALSDAMQDVLLDLVQLRIEPHPLGRRSATWLADLFAKRSTEAVRSTVSFGLDPVGNLARWGALSVDEDTVAGRLAGTIAGLRDSGFSGPFAEADGRSYHEAGASDGQELGIALATAAWYVRTLCESGLTAAEAFSSIGISLAADQQQLATIAKMRAMRLLWRRFQDVCGGDRVDLCLHAESARRMMMAEDPHTNILRATLSAFAAGVGGADSIVVLPHTWALGLADRQARRIARNVHHLLLEESNVHRVTDPAAGSGAIDSLTDGLCQTAWSEFQMIEKEGGVVSSLTGGHVQSRIAKSRERLEQARRNGEDILVGATLFPDPTPPPVRTLDVKRRPDPKFKDIALACDPVAPMDQPQSPSGVP